MRAHRTLPAAVVLGTACFAFLFLAPLHGELPVPAMTTAAGPAPTARGSNPRQTPVVEVVRRIKGSVVNIHSERTVRAPATEELFSLTPSQNRVNGMGTGIVIDPRGYVITNQHVVDDVSSLRVRLADGTTIGARVLARDAESDLALIKINPPRPLPVMPLGTVRDLEVGETVVAVGNAYGYDHTVTVGVVSAIGRDVTLNREVRYRSLIQTDASINPGNSGGPLVNMNGELVGVNVAIRAGAQGIGFAIPVDNMIKSASAMLAQVRLHNDVGPLGLIVRDDIVSTASTRRVVVEQVTIGAAQKAGLRRGDELVRVADVPIASSVDVQRGLIGRTGGEHVALSIRRDGIERRLDLSLEAAPKGQQQLDSEVGDSQPAGAVTSGGSSAAGAVWRALGLRLRAVASAADITRDHPQLHGGLVITEVRTDSPSARAGLRAGDVLVGLHQWEMMTLDNVAFVVNHSERHSFSPLRFYILRGGQVHRGYLQPID
jgi:serine protease Do